MIITSQLPAVDWVELSTIHDILSKINDVTSCVTVQKSVSVGTALMAIQCLYQEVQKNLLLENLDPVVKAALIGANTVICKYKGYYEQDVFLISTSK